MDETRPPSESAPPVPATGAELSAGAHYRVAFDNSHEAIVIAQDGVLKVANPAAARITELRLEQLIGKPFLDLIHPGDQSYVLDLYARRLAGDTAERSMVARLVRPSGGIVVLEAHSMPVQWDERPAVLVFLGDVTDREQVRSDAQEMSRRLARIAEVAPYFLFIYDYDLGRDIYINRSVPAALGYSPAEAAALGPYPFEKLCHPDDMAEALDRDTRWQGFVDGSSLTRRLPHAAQERRMALVPLAQHAVPARRQGAHPADPRHDPGRHREQAQRRASAAHRAPREPRPSRREASRTTSRTS